MQNKINPITFVPNEEHLKEIKRENGLDGLKTSLDLIHVPPSLNEQYNGPGYKEVTICGNCHLVSDTYINSVFTSKPCKKCGSRGHRPKYSAKWIKTSKWWQFFKNEGYWKFSDN